MGQQRAALTLALACVLFLVSGCAKPLAPGRDAVSAVDIEGAPSEFEGEVEDGLATQPSSRVLGLWIPGTSETSFWQWYEYSVLERESLAQDLERIQRQLRRRGYYEARVTAARVVRIKGTERVRVEIQVVPGKPVLVRTVRTKGLADLPFEVSKAASEVLLIRKNQRFDEGQFEEAKVRLSNTLADYGYAFNEVEGTADVDLIQHAADIDFVVEPGKRSVYGRIDIEGLGDLPEPIVRETLQIEEGGQYSRTDLDLARSALLQLGAFSRVEIAPRLDAPESGVVPVVVRLTEGALRRVQLGGGFRLDVLRTSAHLRMSWEHRNFFGGFRTFRATDRPGVTFYPTNFDLLVAPIKLLPENSLNLRLEQPSFLEGRTRGFIDASYNVYPLLYPLPEDADPEIQRIIGYNEVAQSVGVDRVFWGGRLPVTLSYNWQANFPFLYQSSAGETSVPGLDTVIVSYPDLTTILDLRDNPVNTTTGVYLSNSFQFANPLLGGSVTDFRIRPEARGFVPLNFSKTVVLAARVTLGFVFPQNYGETLDSSSPAFRSVLVDPTDPAVVADQHKLLFRAFYSGGPSSNRGYPYRRVGPQGPIGFLSPTGQDCRVFDDAGNRRPLPNSCIRPLGGFTLWETSLELRLSMNDPWHFVAFVDASNVNDEVGSPNILAPHVSAGPGVRYNSPVGPIRFDVGYRIPGLQLLQEDPNVLDVSQVEPYVDQSWYQRFNLNLLIGEAF